MFKFLVLCTLVLSAATAQAEVIQFDMSELTGSSGDSLKVDSLVYEGPTAAVNSVSFRVTGVVTDLGEICCGGPEICPGGTNPWFLAWWGTIERSEDPVYDKWVASTPSYLDQAIPFDMTDDAESQNGFPTMSDGDVFDVRLYFGKGRWIGECNLIRPPVGTMYTVTILMDVTYPVGTEATTWGRIKALYE